MLDAAAVECCKRTYGNKAKTFTFVIIKCERVQEVINWISIILYALGSKMVNATAKIICEMKECQMQCECLCAVCFVPGDRMWLYSECFPIGIAHKLSTQHICAYWNILYTYIHIFFRSCGFDEPIRYMLYIRPATRCWNLWRDQNHKFLYMKRVRL